MTQEGQETSSPSNNVTSNIDELEAGLMQLRDNIANKANPMDVLTTAHLQIHPLPYADVWIDSSNTPSWRRTFRSS